MARQNNMLPKGAGSHLRQPHATHDPSAPAQGYGSAYQQPYDPAESAGQAPAGAGTRDIFSTLRPDSRFEPFAPPAGRPQAQASYGRPPYSDQDGQAYPAQSHTHDPYGRPLPGGYPAQGGYAEPEPEHDPRYYGQQPQHGYAPQQGQYGHDDRYAYDDPYRPGAADPYAAGQPAHGADPGYYEEDYVEEAEAPARRGPRAIVVVGALIGAIALGGGLAYGYKAMTSGGRDGGKLPILRADSAPTKAQPTDAGGKQMPHTDKKFLNSRLTEDRAPARPVPVSILPPTPERETGDGPRRVPTMVVNRDGTIAPGGAPSAPPSSGVPGLLIDGLGSRPPPPPQREAAPPPPPPPARAIPVEEPMPAAPPRRVAAAPSAATIEPPVAALPAPKADPAAKRAVPTRQAARTPAAQAPAAPAAAAPASGYVAVLSSRQSHMDALKSLADIQQKHPGVLQGRATDVRQADLGDKGVWYRVVVGPPGSREAANNVCGQLKTQGYSGCWIMSY